MRVRFRLLGTDMPYLSRDNPIGHTLFLQSGNHRVPPVIESEISEASLCPDFLPCLLPALVGVGFNRFCDRHLCVAACHLRRVGIGPHQFSDALLVESLCEPVIFSPERFPDLNTIDLFGEVIPLTASL